MRRKRDTAAAEPTWESVTSEMLATIFDAPGFMTCSLGFAKPLQDGSVKASLREIELDGRRVFQLELNDGRAASISNNGRRAARTRLAGLLAQASHAHVATTSVDLHARLTRKGRALLSRSRPLQREAPRQAHDREKDHPLARIDSAALLVALGFSDARGNLLPSMRAKYRQVNEFLRIVEAALPRLSGDAPLRLFDAGCGKAYLSIAAQVYLTQRLSRRVILTGVDRREDVIKTCSATVERLGLEPDSASFAVGDIASYDPAQRPDIVMSLHACDTASDEAMARGVALGARTILCAPCCQHQIQSQLEITGPQRALLRHGILKERFADLLADALRAQLLRVLGYSTRVVEFVEPEATARNIMIRAERGPRPGMADAVQEYLDLRDAWGAVPPLESLAGPQLAGLL